MFGVWRLGWASKAARRAPRRSQRNPSVKKNVRLRLEPLEDRTLLTTVTSLADSGSGTLRDALANTSAGGTIDFKAGLTGTINLTSAPLTVANSVTITGPTSGVISVSGGDAMRVFVIDSGTTVSISNLTITDGTSVGGGTSLNDEGGGIYSAGTLTVSNCTIQNCTAKTGLGDGAGIFGADNTTMTVSGCTFTNDSAGGNGGGIATGSVVGKGSTLAVTNSTFTNDAGTGGTSSGGAIYVAGTATITGSTFTSNSAKFSGGAVQLAGVVGASSTLVVSNSTFNKNAATGGASSGGGMYADGTTTITGSAFTNNTAPASGSAFEVDGGSATVTGCTVTGNVTSNSTGFGVVTVGQNMKAASTFSQCIIANNTGIGLDILSQSATLDSSTVSGNNGGGFGAGISFAGKGTLTIVDATVANNNNGTIGGGGGLFTFGNVTIRNSTFAFNNGGMSGGNLDIANGTTTLYNSIISGGTATFGPDINIGVGKLVDQGYNIISNIRDINNPNTTLAATDLKNVNPFLSPLQNNGGPTPTMLPLSGSPAIDSGDPNFTPPPAKDQRGQPRVANGRVDIGAIEVGPGDNTGGGGNGGGGTGGGTGGGIGGLPPVSLAIPRGVRVFAAGADDGAPNVLVWNAATKGLLGNFFAYDPNFTGGVRVAVGDVTGDGIPDIVTAPGPTGGPDIRVFDGASGLLVREFNAFDPNFTGGCYVADGDINGDGTDDIIVSADTGGGPNIVAFSGKDGSQLDNFNAFNPRFTGGVRLAVGDVNGDGFADIIAGAGPGGGPNVTVFSGKDLTRLDSFFAFNPNFTGGVYVGAAQTDSSGRDNIIVGAGAGGGPNVVVFNSLMGEEVLSFLAFDPAFTGGVRVAGVNRNPAGTGSDSILATPGPGGGADINTFDSHTGGMVDDFFCFNPPYAGGLFVAGAPAL